MMHLISSVAGLSPVGNYFVPVVAFRAGMV
jgi:hypothetical protein